MLLQLLNSTECILLLNFEDLDFLLKIINVTLKSPDTDLETYDKALYLRDLIVEFQCCPD